MTLALTSPDADDMGSATATCGSCALDEDLAARRRYHRFWASPRSGSWGVQTDQVACVITALGPAPPLRRRGRRGGGGGGQRFGDHVERFYGARSRTNDLTLTYAMCRPQVDTQLADRYIATVSRSSNTGVVRETRPV